MHVFHALTQAIRGPRWLQAFNQRNHRKLMVVDERDRVLRRDERRRSERHSKARHDAKAKSLPTSAGWRDVHARMVGPRASEIAAIMDRLWKRVHHETRGKSPKWRVPNFATDAGRFVLLSSIRDRRSAIADRTGCWCR